MSATATSRVERLANAPGQWLSIPFISPSVAGQTAAQELSDSVATNRSLLLCLYKGYLKRSHNEVQ